MKQIDSIDGLPGEAMMREGLADFLSGQTTIPACLVGIARSKLSRIGFLPPSVTREMPDAELVLYRLLRQNGGDAYSRYNSLLRELVSFEQALERRHRANTITSA